MLLGTALRLINHLLAAEDWARARLKTCAGHTARLEFGALTLPLSIGADGLFVAADRDAAADVTIALPADALRRALADRRSLFAAAHVAGPAELAETLGFVFRNLRWDAEGDLAQLLGDIAAHRLLAGGQRLLRWHLQQANNLAANLAEYLTEEKPAIARRADVADFCRQTAQLGTVLDGLESRIARIERSA